MHKLLAQVVNIDGNDGSGISIQGPENFKFGGDSIGYILGQSLSFVFAAAGIGLLLMIISSGFSIMMSAGDAKKLAGGKATLTNSIIGFILIFAAFWIVQILGVVLGWDNYIGAIFGQ